MTKQEFVDDLRRNLTGHVSIEKVNETVSYYEDYITAQIRMGNDEKAVFEALGDARLIAISIIDADKHKKNAQETKENETGRRRFKTGGVLSFLMEHPVLGIFLLLLAIAALVALGVWLAVSFISVFWPVLLFGAVALLAAFLTVQLLKIIVRNHE